MAGSDPEALPVQPDRRKPFYVQAKAERLVRRGRDDYRIVARKPNGDRMEVRLVPGYFQIEGL